MKYTCISGGRIVDPANGRDEIGNVWFGDGRIVPAPAEARDVERVDARGGVVMAGAIDVHTHVAGGNIAAARLLLPERYRDVERPVTDWTGAPFDAETTGALYALMGYTLVVEPAIAPTDATATHAELETIPYVDRAGLAVLGNDEVLLGLVRDRASTDRIADYVGWSLSTTRSIGVKAINPGGAAAFKANVRTFDLDDLVPEYGVSARQIGTALRRALGDLKVPHPLHLHTTNLGLPDSVASALDTIDASEGEPLHLAHLQFYAYGKEGSFGFSSGAARLAERLQRNPNVSVDIGQVVFGPTVTVSSDVLTQFNARRRARPKKWTIRDGDANGGGIVPFTYRAKSPINALQWAIGLELFLLIDDPWHVHLTTDHPNGGPFTSYPEIIAWLMDRDARDRMLTGLPKAALEVTTLPSIKRTCSLSDIAIMTRAAPAKLLGLADRGHLGVGARADVAVYRDGRDRAQMFRHCTWLFKEGVAAVRDGKLEPLSYGKTLAVTPTFDRRIVKHIEADYEARWSAPPDTFAVPERLLRPASPFEVVPCRS